MASKYKGVDGLFFKQVVRMYIYPAYRIGPAGLRGIFGLDGYCRIDLVIARNGICFQGNEIGVEVDISVFL